MENPKRETCSFLPNASAVLSLSDHFKSGQQLSLQNRPTGLAVRD
jgi:hypothetical protein